MRISLLGGVAACCWLALASFAPLSEARAQSGNFALSANDNHTTVVYLLILAAGKKPADYHFFHSQLYGGSWLTNTPGMQLQAQKKIVAWWHRHHVTSASAIAPTKSRTATHGHR